MIASFQTAVVLTSLLLGTWCQKSKENDDEGRPYEFSFTIDGQQHRYEKRDVNGIIQGEFGFVTADGVYHVTVYATDENGSFRILSMKNIKLGPSMLSYSKSPPYSTEPGTRLSSKQPEVPAKPEEKLTTLSKVLPYVFTTAPTIRPGCSGCGIISTTTVPSGAPTKFPFQLPQFKDTEKKNTHLTGYRQNQNKALSIHIQNVKDAGNSSIFRKASTTMLVNQNNNIFPQSKPLVQDLNLQNIGGNFFHKPQLTTSSPEKKMTLSGGGYHSTTSISTENLVATEIENFPAGRVDGKNMSHIFTSKPKSDPKQNQVTVSNGIISVPDNPPIPIKDKYPNMKNGLPDGITREDILDLLYKFNYTIGFHGHYEKGLKNGTKIGGYFVNGRDGISRVVTYVADEFGYRPKVKFINLGLSSIDTPTENTEKMFGLKGFEFIWYPVM